MTTFIGNIVQSNINLIVIKYKNRDRTNSKSPLANMIHEKWKIFCSSTLDWVKARLFGSGALSGLMLEALII